MLIELDIAKALRDHLALLPSPPPIATECATFKPSTNAPWLAEFSLGGIQIMPSLHGTDAIIKGIYQVDINTPTAGGKWQNLQLADKIMAHFAKDTTFSKNHAKITIIGLTRSSLMVVEGFVKSSVSITYVATEI